MKNQTKLFDAGFKPVFKIMNKNDRELRPWNFIPSPMRYHWDEETELFTVKWNYVFSTDMNNVVYFAYSFPYTFLEMTKQLDSIQENAVK